ncbi:MAG: DEAD/DEAH box helicase [Acidimicrobiia bacterium]|nr:DEAD/DEAH box helicase [Acidimicrobiia bacterium]
MAEAAEVRQAFIDRLSFTPDDFQLEAFDGIDDDRHVIVAAPTGAGKTLVADYAVNRVLDAGARVFYTTPIKALSNQKFFDLGEQFGRDRVGLLTGDNSINADAPVVVMTTEVLRNMLYAGTDLDALAAVVLDEVHYLQDAYRGPVWEEVIIHLPRRIRLICLSATVSNADELAAWIETVRGETRLVVETERPVDLTNLYMVGERSGSHIHLLRTIKGSEPNPKGFRYDNQPSNGRRRGGRSHSDDRSKSGGRPKWRTPRRIDVIKTLKDRDLLPAIYFIFSRAGCDDAARAVIDSGLHLIGPEQRQKVAEIVDSHVHALDPSDLEVLDYGRFRRGLMAGVAAHHAGMVPPFKEAVEACFIAGLVKVVFATETLALGVNMPARTVVIEKLTKFTGETHEFLTPAQYTQLTGRAGRRGIDSHGQAVVLWSPYTTFEQVANLALSKRFVLRSSFRPTYNMAANLVRRYTQDRARQLLNLSFAQYRIDAGVVREENRIERLVERRRQLINRLEADHGSIDDLRSATVTPSTGSVDDQEMAFALAHLAPGDVVRLHSVGGGRDARARTSVVAVLAVAFRSRGRIRVTVVDTDGDSYELTPDELLEPPDVVATVELPEPYLPNSVSFAHEVARQLKNRRLARPSSNGRGGGKSNDGRRSGTRDRSRPAILTKDDVPPDARRGLKRLEKIEADLARARQVASGRADSLAGQFDRVIDLLTERGHLLDWELTDSGERIARLYHESDLLVAETLEAGLFDGLDPAEVAALASVFVYEERRSSGTPGRPWYPSADMRRRFRQIQARHLDLNLAEEESQLPPTRAPDPGFVAVAHGWASGVPLDDILGEEDLTAGDFIRTTKQLIDLLRQLGQLAPDPETARSARSAADAVHRDLVAASSAIEFEGDDDADSSTVEPVGDRP